MSVHRAINNKEGVSETARQEILQVADGLGYTVNYVASALKRRQLNVAVVLPTADGSGRFYFRNMWLGYRTARDEVSGYNLNVMEYPFSTDDDGHGSEDQERILKALYDEWGDHLDGLLIAATLNSPRMERILAQFASRGVSVILIDNDFAECGRLCCIAPNDTYTGQLSAELMNMALGGRKGTILVAEGDEFSWSHKMNQTGFYNYFKEHNPDISICCVSDLHDEEANCRQMTEVLMNDPDIIGAYSMRARHTIPMCRALCQSGRQTEIFAVGSDLFQESAQMLRDGVLKAIIYKAPYEKGYKGFKTLFECLIKGVKPEKEEISVQISIILQNNIKFFEEYI